MLSRCRKRVRSLPNSEPLSVWMQRRGKGKLPRSPGRTRQTAAVVRASQDGSRQHAAAVALLEGDDVPNPCRRRPRCANLVHVGPPVVCRVFGLAYPTARPDSFSPPLLSHMSWNITLIDSSPGAAIESTPSM